MQMAQGSTDLGFFVNMPESWDGDHPWDWEGNEGAKKVLLPRKLYGVVTPGVMTPAEGRHLDNHS